MKVTLITIKNKNNLKIKWNKIRVWQGIDYGEGIEEKGRGRGRGRGIWEQLKVEEREAGETDDWNTGKSEHETQAPRVIGDRKVNGTRRERKK